MANHTCIVVAVTVLALIPTASAQQFFTDRAAFLANVQPGYDEEKFEAWATGEPLDGHQAEWEAAGTNGFSWIASATGPGNQRLYSLNSALSTSSHEDALIFQFSGNAVYAFGGEFWGTEYDGFPLSAEITFETDTGETFSHTVSGRSFIGFVSNVPLTSIIINAIGAQAAWPTADNIITGDLNPDGDLDGDGMSNHAEQLAGTDLGDPKSNLRITSTAFDGLGFVVGFATVSGKTYRLEYKTAITDTDWLPAPVPDQTATATGAAQFTDPSTPQLSKRFYRITLIQPDI